MIPILTHKFPPGGRRLAAYALLSLGGLSGVGCTKQYVVPDSIDYKVENIPASAVSVDPGDAVVYEAYVRDCSTDGDFDGLTQRLDSIKRLGCNVIWLMPIHPIGVLKRVGALGSPYSPRDYMAVNPEYGNLAAFDRFVAAAHARKLVVILDWVANHTSWDHAWITQHPDWYTKGDDGKITAPIGQNWSDVADLDFSKAAMRIEMIHQMGFWVRNHSVDGFRCDAAGLVPDDFWSQAIDSLRAIRSNLLWLAEDNAPQKYADGFQLTYGWGFYATLKQVLAQGGSAASLASTHAAETQNVPGGRYRLRFTTNHDFTFTEGPPTEVFGSAAAAQAAYVATLAYGATPMIYSGQEAGEPAKLDLFSKATINWAGSPATTAFYRQVLNLYDSLPALRTGTVSQGTPSADVVSVLRALPQQRVVVMANMRNHITFVSIPTAWQAVSWVDAVTGQPVTAGTVSYRLQPYGYAIWRSQ